MLFGRQNRIGYSRIGYSQGLCPPLGFVAVLYCFLNFHPLSQTAEFPAVPAPTPSSAVVALLTDGDSDNISVGRNGVFYDREGRDWDATIARIVADHTASIRLHAAVGFQHVGVEREVGRKFGRWLDVVLMQKLL